MDEQCHGGDDENDGRQHDGNLSDRLVFRLTEYIGQSGKDKGSGTDPCQIEIDGD